MSNVVHGKDVAVLCVVDGTPIAIGCATNSAWQFENELIGKTDRNAGSFRKKRVRMSDVRGQVSGLMTLASTATRLSVVYFLQEAIRRSELDMIFSFTDEAGLERQIAGKFLVQAVALTHDVSSFGEFDLSLEGTGDITIGEPDSPAEFVCPRVFSDWWETEEGETSITGPGVSGKSFTGHNMIEVDREGTQFDYTDGTLGDRQYTSNGTAPTAETQGTFGTTISFRDGFNPGEKIFVIWEVENG